MCTLAQGRWGWRSWGVYILVSTFSYFLSVVAVVSGAYVFIIERN